MINTLSYHLLLGNSDHVCIEFNLVCYTEQKKCNNVKYNLRAPNFDTMKESLSNVDCEGSMLPTLHLYIKRQLLTSQFNFHFLHDDGIFD